ncbi:MAG: type II toxin-antitoxin system RelE/ParE family toxin, partial [Burkholderiaceae bacterium]|nr:type II toxin-antitoxin system RelE/ParE family toxin [Burkholderiaceae bacterium]
MNQSWNIKLLNKAVERELNTLDTDMRAKFAQICDLLAKFGPEQVGLPHIKHLNGDLWEIRLKCKSGAARAIYVAASARTITIVHLFVKKT